MLETELKCIITYDTFKKIEHAYKWDKIITQTNHYYRSLTPVLKENGITFRVREIDNKYKLQIKKHTNSNSPLQICEETEEVIDAVPDFFEAKDVLELTGVDGGDVFLIGSATTKRYSLMWDGHTEICLDYTTYFDTEDYEVELEYTGEISSALLDEMKALGVEFKEKSKGKYSRFIKRFSELANNLPH